MFTFLTFLVGFQFGIIFVVAVAIGMTNLKANLNKTPTRRIPGAEPKPKPEPVGPNPFVPNILS